MKSHRERRGPCGDLANLELTEERARTWCGDLNSILGYIDRLNQLNTDGIEPMAQASDRYGVDELKIGSERFAYASREDVPNGLRPSLPHERGSRKRAGCGRHFLQSS